MPTAGFVLVHNLKCYIITKRGAVTCCPTGVECVLCRGSSSICRGWISSVHAIVDQQQNINFRTFYHRHNQKKSAASFAEAPLRLEWRMQRRCGCICMRGLR